MIVQKLNHKLIMYSEKKPFKTRRKNAKKGDGIVDLFG